MEAMIADNSKILEEASNETLSRQMQERKDSQAERRKTQARINRKTKEITPCIWFNYDDGHLKNVIAYYEEIFYPYFTSASIISLGDTPGGYTEMCDVIICGKKYTFLNTSKEHHPLNDAISFIIHCENQSEIDMFWDYFTKDGSEGQCGWCLDKFGLRWQIIPFNLDLLMSRPNANTVIMNQKKIIIDEY